MSNISKSQRTQVIEILRQFLPKDIQVYAYGSRVTGKARTYSDLDIAIKGNEPLSFELLGQLKEAFSESDLPFMVDLIDLNAISTEFFDSIRDDLEPVY